MEGKDLFFLQARLTNLFRLSFCQVFTSREFKCCGAVGGLSYAPEILKGHHCGSDESELRQSSSFDTRSLGKKGPCVAETEIGEGNTCQWVWMAQHSKGGVVSIYFLHFEGSTWDMGHRGQGGGISGPKHDHRFLFWHCQPAGAKFVGMGYGQGFRMENRLW